MQHNLGMTDRYIRITVGGLMIATGAAQLARRADLTGAALGLLGGMMLAEGALGVCPLYEAMGMNTNPDPPPGSRANDIVGPYEAI
jgi:uncharacterized membrane protein